MVRRPRRPRLVTQLLGRLTKWAREQALLNRPSTARKLPYILPTRRNVARPLRLRTATLQPRKVRTRWIGKPNKRPARLHILNAQWPCKVRRPVLPTFRYTPLHCPRLIPVRVTPRRQAWSYVFGVLGLGRSTKAKLAAFYVGPCSFEPIRVLLKKNVLRLSLLRKVTRPLPGRKLNLCRVRVVPKVLIACVAGP